MPFRTFSNVLNELYGLGAHTTPDKLPVEMLHVIQPLLHFDGAVWGYGRLDKTLQNGLAIEKVYLYNRDKNLPEEYAMVSADEPDPIFRTMLDNLPSPLICDRIAFYEERNMPKLCEYARAHGLRKLLMYGEPPRPGSNRMRWLALYRDSGQDFSEAEAELLCTLWPHLLQVSRINLQCSLDRIDEQRAALPMALIDSHGEINAADMAWNDLLKLEWPSFNGYRLQPAVIASLVNTGVYRGKRIEISGSSKFGYMACMAKAIPSIKTILAPSELNVADSFAKGMTHTEIASHLKVSPHTVRNQLAHIYQKLGIHSKAELARVMASR
jgi:DNA-binding CsgD family transcriptional regulator